ncbi:MAG: hypothetical protein M3Z10_01455 [Gemmatimonadota bacterium]|nr:hypothetical protein [Gemmatimonadota bacterium]
MHPRTLMFALLAFARPLHAQLAEAQPGARVRLEAPGIVAGRYEGTVLTRNGDTLRVGGPNSQPVMVPIDRLTAFEVSRGSSRTLGAQHGVAWGSAVGLALGLAVLSSFTECSTCSDDSSGKAGFVLYMTTSGALWGAGLGALIGRERWERFDLAPRPITGLQGGRPSFGLSVQL